MIVPLTGGPPVVTYIQYNMKQCNMKQYITIRFRGLSIFLDAVPYYVPMATRLACFVSVAHTNAIHWDTSRRVSM